MERPLPPGGTLVSALARPLLLGLAVAGPFLFSAEGARAFTPETRLEIVRRAATLMPDSLQRQLERHVRPLYAGALENGGEQLELRAPMRYHIRGWRGLAKTEDPRAITELADRYAKPKTPKEQARYLIASAAADGYDAATVESFDAWRGRADSPEDAWLWFHALRAHVDTDSIEPVVQVALTHKSPFLRAAAVEALAAERKNELYDVINSLAADLPKKPAEKAVVLGALSTAVLKLANKRTRTDAHGTRACAAAATAAMP